MKISFLRRSVSIWQDSLLEVKKMVWPNKKETFQAIAGVLVMVFLMGILLWTVDSILIRAVAWILGR